MFDHIAPDYDRLNHSLSLGQDLLWRLAAARRARLVSGEVAMDVGVGTGDLAIALLRGSAPDSRAVGVDLSTAMFARAREKVARAGLTSRVALVQGSVLQLPSPDAAFDRVVSGFTLRNVADLSRAVAEMHRVLRPGGRAVLLELSRPRPAPFARAYRAYFYGVLPRIAAFLGGDPGAYTYLPGSLTRFPDVDELGALLQNAGFRAVSYTRLSLGIATIHEGVR